MYVLKMLSNHAHSPRKRKFEKRKKAEEDVMKEEEILKEEKKNFVEENMKA